MHVILTNFPAVRTGRSCLWKSFEKQSSCRAPIRAITIEMEWVWLWQFNAWRNWVLLLSCDNILKFDWYCQLLAAEVTIWTHGSCQAISPTAWEQGQQLLTSLFDCFCQSLCTLLVLNLQFTEAFYLHEEECIQVYTWMIGSLSYAILYILTITRPPEYW